ncbi:MAG: hypothetical protein AB8C84_02975 [Oligoflexales bacterium]
MKIPPVVSVVEEDAPVEVFIEASGAKEIEWQHQQKKICKEKKCAFETKNWTRGRHHILVNLNNAVGGVQFSFNIDIVERGFGKKIETVTLENVRADKHRLYEFKKSGSIAKVIRGRGFVTIDDRVTLLQSTGQVIQWKGERLHASGDGIFHIQGNKEEYFAFPGAIIFLNKYKSSQYIDLRRGWLRSRFFKKKPKTHILAGWLDVMPGDSSDFIVRLRKNGMIDIVVLRGLVRAHWFDQEGQGREQVIAYHHHAYMTEKKGQILVQRLSHLEIEKLVASSTPGLLIVEPDEDDYTFVRPSKNAKSAMKRYSSSPDDSVANLQILMPFVRDDEAKDDMLLATSRSSQHLGLYEQSKTLLEELDDEVEASYWEAQMQLSRLNFQKSADLLDVASDFEAQRDTLNYYQGVAEYHTGDPRSAKVYFQKSLWERSEGPIADSSRKFIHAVHQRIPYELRTYGGLIRNNQVLGLQPEAEAPKGIVSRSSLGFSYDVEMIIPYTRNWRGYLEFITGSQGVLYFESQLQSASTFDASASMRAELKAGGVKKGESLFALRAEPALRSVLVGSARAADQLETNWEVQFLRLWSRPGWRYQKIQTIDPQPTIDDALDIVLDEAVPANDRSVVSWQHFWFMEPYRHRDVVSDLYLRVKEANYTNAAVKDSFKDVDVGLKLEWQFDPRWSFMMNLERGTRHFLAKERVDQKNILDLRGELRLHPRWFFHAGMKQVNQTSSEESYSIQKQILSSGFVIQY